MNHIALLINLWCLQIAYRYGYLSFFIKLGGSLIANTLINFLSLIFFNGCGLCLEYFSMHWDVVTNTCMLLVGIEWVFVSFDTFSILNAEVISSTKWEWCRHCFPKKLPNFWLQFYSLSCSSAWTQLLAKILALTGFLLGSNKPSVIVQPYLVSWTPVYEELP